MEKEYNCEHSVVLLNHYAASLICKFRCYVMDGHVYSISKETAAVWFLDFPKKYFYAKAFSMSYEQIENCVIMDSETGETWPLFMIVPCGKCIICREKRRNDWAIRAAAETAYAKYAPLLITLTYNNAHLPAEGLKASHIEMFFKHMHNWFDKHYPDVEFRYIGCGEYGTHTKRPHYHIQLWNFPQNSSTHMVIINRIIQRFWSNAYQERNEKGQFLTKYDHLGFVNVKRCDNGASMYVNKYITKGREAPKGQTPNFSFRTRSRRSGAIGYQWIKDNWRQFMDTPDRSIKILDKFSGKVCEGQMPRYYRDMLFPTLSKIVKQKWSRMIKETYMMIVEYCLYADYHSHDVPNILPEFEQFLDKFAPTGLIPDYLCAGKKASFLVSSRFLIPGSFELMYEKMMDNLDFLLYNVKDESDEIAEELRKAKEANAEYARYCSMLPHETVEAKVMRLERRARLAELREKF